MDSLHPQRNHPDRAKLNEGRDQAKYAAYLRGQVKELLTGFGKVDLIFFDFSYPADKTKPADWVGKGRADWDSENLIAMVRELQPGIMVNDRLDLQDVPGGWDYQTPEQFMVAEQPTDGGQAGRVGDLPDLLRLLGLPPRRADLEVGRATALPADRHGQQGR